MKRLVFFGGLLIHTYKCTNVVAVRAWSNALAFLIKYYLFNIKFNYTQVIRIPDQLRDPLMIANAFHV